MIPERQWISCQRLVIHRLMTEGFTDSFAEDVRQGLSSSPKSLPPKYFYDELGSQLFEAICRLPEYYLTRAESDILSRFAEDAIRRLTGPVSLVEFGSGSATKTTYLIDAIFRRQADLHYQPVDISPSALESSAEKLLDEYAGLRITGYAGDYYSSMQALRQQYQNRPRSKTLLALFLGSNIGNFTPDEAHTFLTGIREIMKPGDGLLLGADLKKDPAILEAAYDDAIGVTAAFNLNLLQRMNRELGAHFDIRSFQHKAIYNQELGRIEMHLVSRIDQVISIDSLKLEILFKQGETIHTENSYKFDKQRLADMASKAGFKLSETWLDQHEQFSFNLLLAT
ncbi:MAG TPA: L-histidine N(alpha)-methyltransferase [Blastocatellia bacterium]|nr:L-histidine N(alpha)-methyltransferase [Blastocatellia bacterium]